METTVAKQCSHIVQHSNTVQIMEMFQFFALCCSATRPHRAGGKGGSQREPGKIRVKIPCQREFPLVTEPAYPADSPSWRRRLPRSGPSVSLRPLVTRCSRLNAFSAAQSARNSTTCAPRSAAASNAALCAPTPAVAKKKQCRHTVGATSLCKVTLSNRGEGGHRLQAMCSNGVW